MGKYVAIDSDTNPMNINAEKIKTMVGRRIKMRRVELDIKQTELAAMLGFTQAQISSWEAGRRTLRIEHAAALAKALNTTVGSLVGENGRQF